MNNMKITPFVKWAGGKTQLIDKLISKKPNEFNNYYEPFIGGGAFLYELKPENAIIGDINEQLINVYKQIKIVPEELIMEINTMDSHECDKEYYLDIRSSFNDKIIKNELDVECAAKFIWLNKHCFNGLYRVNQKGLFNVPYNNKKNGYSIVEENIRNISRFLNDSNIKIISADFEEICATVKKGDFVYFDSPYVPESETAYFTDYTKNGFNKDDHERLARLYKDLDKRGAYLMLSNNNVPIVHELYKEFNIEEIEVKRLINRNANKRKGKEVIITNY